MEKNNSTNRLRRNANIHRISEHEHRLEIIEAYSDWVARLERHGQGSEIYYASHVTLLFNDIPGDFRRKYDVMTDEAERIYATFLRHIVHDARAHSAQAKLPLWIVVPDLPKRNSDISEFRLNDGLHLNGPMLIPIDTRMLETLWMHMHPEAKSYKFYIRPDRALARIHIEPIKFSPERMTDYAFKTLKVKIPDLDTILIFPKTVSQLPDRVRAE
jgi:hypothetical protein